MNTQNQTKKGRSGFAIAGFVIALVGWIIPFVGPILAIVFSALGLKSKKRGFAIAGLIIGILGLLLFLLGIVSTIVFGSLGEAREKAVNAANRSRLSQVRMQAEIVYHENMETGPGSYDGLCESEHYLSLIADMDLEAGQLVNCAAVGQEYRVSVSLDDDDYICVNSDPEESIMDTDRLGTGFACR